MLPQRESKERRREPMFFTGSDAIPTINKFACIASPLVKNGV
jgi:hypothetical protein